MAPLLVSYKAFILDIWGVLHDGVKPYPGAIDCLRALARDLHEQCGGPGVGAIGMCFTGGFALAMAVEDTLLAPVLSQPSLPFAGGKARKRALGLLKVRRQLVDDQRKVRQQYQGDGSHSGSADVPSLPGTPGVGHQERAQGRQHHDP